MAGQDREVRGLDSPTASERELFHVLSATRAEIFWRLRLPRAMPMLFSSLRIASATAVIGAIVGEWIGSDKGLGADHPGDVQLPVGPALCGDRAVIVAVDRVVPLCHRR